MAASYPTSVKSFSAKSTTDVVEAAHPNDLQDEVTAIETALLNGIAHSLITSTTGTRDLGSSSLLFRTAYLDAALILGAATTAGVRLDLESGVLAVREGDDSAYAPMATGKIVTTSVVTASGTQATTSAVAATLFAVPSVGTFLVSAVFDGDAAYQAWAIVSRNTAGARLLTTDSGSANHAISLSGLNVQITQSSGGALDIDWTYTRLGT